MDNQPYSPDPRVQSYQEPYVAPDAPTDQIPANGNASYQRRQENYVGPVGGQVETNTAYVVDKNLNRAIIRSRIAMIGYFILAVLEIILVLRFIFRMLGASQSSSFVAFLYNLSHLFVAPFNGIFNDQVIGNSSVIEASTLVAMLVWALVIWGLVSLGRVIFVPSLKDEQSVTTVRRRTR